MKHSDVTNIEKIIHNHIEKYHLFNPHDIVYAAVSGGMDSMVLLEYLRRYKEKYQIQLKATHVDHNIRKVSEQDAAFVKAHCVKNHLPCAVFSAKDLDPNHNNSEEWAREFRYKCFQRLMVSDNIKIATAHTLSDQAETVIFRLARGGVGIKGISGIPTQRDTFVRPLLAITRAQVECLFDAYNLSCVHDETNDSDIYSRNKIRHHIIPVMKEINPSMEIGIGKLCERFKQSYDFIHQYSANIFNEIRLEGKYLYDNEKYGEYDVPKLMAQPAIIQSEIFRMMIDLHGGTPTEAIIERMEKSLEVMPSENKEIQLDVFKCNEQLTVYITNRRICIYPTVNYFEKALVMKKNTTCLLHVHLNEIRKTTYQNWKSKQTLSLYKDETKNVADLDLIDFSKCVLRLRKNGDAFTPIKRHYGKIGKFLNHIPTPLRNYIPVIEKKNTGEIIWVYGVGFAKGYEPTKSTKRFLWIP